MPNEPIVLAAETVVVGLDAEIDGIPRRQHTLTTRLGTEPIETGAEVTDHAATLPRQVTLSGIITSLNGTDRVTGAWDAIERLWESKEPFRLITEWGVYDDMLIASLPSETAGRGMRFEAHLQQIDRAPAPIILPPPPRVGGGAVRGPDGGFALAEGSVLLGLLDYDPLSLGDRAVVAGIPRAAAEAANAAARTLSMTNRFARTLEGGSFEYAESPRPGVNIARTREQVARDLVVSRQRTSGGAGRARTAAAAREEQRRNAARLRGLGSLAAAVAAGRTRSAAVTFGRAAEVSRGRQRLEGAE